MTRRPTSRRVLGLERLEAREVLSTLLPGDREQYMLELVNQARIAPHAVADDYSIGLDAKTQATARYYNLDLNQVQADIAAIAPQQPLAWNGDLGEAALAHSQDQSTHDFQSHTGSDGSSPDARAGQAGYQGSVRENAFAYARSVDNAMDAFLADWGTDGPHRRNLLEPGTPQDQAAREAGFGIVDDRGFNFGPLVVTQLLGRPSDTRPYLLGAVFDDPNSNDQFDFNEGRGGVDIDIVNLKTGEVRQTQTWESGGWQARVEPGAYEIRASQGGQALGSHRAEVGRTNLKVDFNTRHRPASTPRAVISVAAPVVSQPIPAPTPPPAPRTAPPVTVTVQAPRPTPAPLASPFGSTAVLLSFNSWKVNKIG